MPSSMCEVPGCRSPVNHSQLHNALVVLYEACDELESHDPEAARSLRARADFIRKAGAQR